METKMICDICRREIEIELSGWDKGNNALPIVNGRCCNKCNETIVIPFRITSHRAFEKYRQDILEAYGLEDKE